MMGGSYHSQIEKTGVGWQVHMLDVLYTRSANRTQLERKNRKLVYFIFESLYTYWRLPSMYTIIKHFTIISIFKTRYCEKYAANFHRHCKSAQLKLIFQMYLNTILFRITLPQTKLS